MSNTLADYQTLELTNEPEIELLLCCARTRLDEKITKDIKTLVQSEIDWDYLLEIAQQHGVIPLLYQSLTNTCQGIVPQSIWSELQWQFQTNALRNQLMCQKLIEIINLFNSHDINAISFKGLTLAASAYGNIALRQFGDLDILIAPENINQATEIITEQGYVKSQSLVETELKPYAQSPLFFNSPQYQGSYDFTHQSGTINIELHWSLTRKDVSFPVKFQQLWTEKVQLILLNTEIYNFSPEDLLIFLCLHGSKHCWEEMKWICDVAEIIESHQEIDWNQVLHKSGILGVRRMLNIGLILTQKLLGTTFPEVILQEINRDKIAQSLAQKVETWLFSENVTIKDRHIFIYQSRELFTDKMRYLIHWLIIPTDKEWEFLNLPNYLYFLYYLIRPIRLVIQFSKISCQCLIQQVTSR